MFSLIGNLMASATKKFAAKPDPNVSDGGYRPRSQRGRDAIASMRQSTQSFQEQKNRAEMAGLDAKLAAAKPAPAKSFRFGGLFGRSSAAASPSSGDNAGFADGGIVSNDRSVGRYGSLHGKNMKK